MPRSLLLATLLLPWVVSTTHAQSSEAEEAPEQATEDVEAAPESADVDTPVAEADAPVDAPAEEPNGDPAVAPEGETPAPPEEVPVAEAEPEVEVEAPAPEPPAGAEVRVRSDRPGGTLHFDSDAGSFECRAPCTTHLPDSTYRVTWSAAGADPELLNESLRVDGAQNLRVAYTGPSFVNRLGYWLLGNGLLVGIPVSLGVFVKREDIGTAGTLSIIGINTLVAIAGAILMGVGDDEVVELSD